MMLTSNKKFECLGNFLSQDGKCKSENWISEISILKAKENTKKLKILVETNKVWRIAISF